MYEDDGDRRYTVVRNDAGQYSTWPADRTPPRGWEVAGRTGTKAECLAEIETLWTDLRPARGGRS
ncbi:MbtH family protein [Phytomonospora endophytica]|uniref:MbtH protein n=1 Tax=Phytomonospora endophytica TaxID=714109 RepID=A0A841FQR7_9ACTN|nr:MbtH family protein [Phytomonospora endophytica]MBB6038184.1 MbtH protein [Phytomonospora endophytica]GIG67355.1 hypothetical protein Pen01_36500 [Phytomonospora endophytica]